MLFDYLREPVSDDQPAGPDLEEEMDRDYMNYTLVAGGRMPSSYLIRNPDGTMTVFDRTSIDAPSEMASIDALLGRSKDARLVVLGGQFQALAGSIDGFCDAVTGVHVLCTAYWETFYPRESDGDFTVRQNVLEGLDDLIHVVLPLQYAPISPIGPSRLQQVTLRAYQLAQGKAEPREGEQTASLGALANTLSHDSTKDQLLELHAKVAAAIVQLEEIDKAFLAHDAGMNMPSFAKVVDVLKLIVEVIATNRPELVVARAAEEELEEEGESDSGAAPELKGKVKTHGQAKAALGAVERYLLMMEPSNPAMILVHQARMLFGRPLVEALDALMPDSARRAVFRFDAGMSFEIDISRMRSVSEHAMSDDNDIAATIPAAASMSTSASAAATPEYGPDVELDAWGQPIDRSAPPPPRLDAWGQPIVDTPAPAGPRLDAWGQPIVEDAAPAVRLDAWGQPIVEDAVPTVRLDAWGQPIVDAGPPPRLDAWGQPIIEAAPPAAPAPEAAPAPAAAEEPATAPPAAAPAPVKPPPPPPPPPETVFVVTTRGQASDLIQAVEGFFRQAEPSSSLPILLAKARGYLNRDFASILSELIPRLPDGS